ncbi:MAG: DUF4149 domain-containing protein [Deltaproteobacteria bacterium]|nr:DUF4149 domain-containing protein [Deltaproteobacteria bacterium]
MAFFNLLLNLFLGIWLGVMICFSFITAPTLFREIPREMAGELISKIFSQYYLSGYACLGIAFISLVLKGLWSKPFPVLRCLLLALCFGLTVYAGAHLHPKAHMVKTMIRTLEEGPDKERKQAEFATLHRQSVLLNGIVLLTVLLVFVLNFTPLKL